MPAPAVPAPAPAVVPGPVAQAAPGYARWESEEPGRRRQPEPPRPWESPADLDTRAADLAARVAMLVSGGSEPDRPGTPYEAETHNLSAYLSQPGPGQPGAGNSGPGQQGLSQQGSGQQGFGQQGFGRPDPAGGREPLSEMDAMSRAEAVRRTAARLAGNAARGRSTLPPPRRTDDETGATTRGGHRR